MKKNLKKLALTLALVAVCGATFAQKSLPKEPTPTWDMEALCEVPPYRVLFEENGVVGIIYNSIDYCGHSKEVFAYYATPGTLSGDRSKDQNLPAVVCVHGGGGKAFDNWVKIWAKRGYAAISMDLRGYGKDRELLPLGFQEGVTQKTPNFVAHDEQSEDWFYQAIPDVVLAHSLIRSLPEIDTTRTAITGISWGGIITTLVSGLDPRFKAGVPVYGCGHLYMEGSMAPQIEDNTELAQQRWYNQYDPALYVKDADIPMLFVNGTNDAHFFVNQWHKTTELVSDKQYSMRLRMKHGHNAGWAPEEIYTFIDNILGVTKYTPTPEFSKLKFKKGRVSCRVANVNQGDKVSVVYTNDVELSNASEWVKVDVEVVSGSISVDLGEGCHVCYISVETPKSGHFSSRLLFN